MNRQISLSSFVGNRRVIDVLLRAVERQRLPHAMIFAGPEGVGKTTAAVLLARLLNCPVPEGGDACGECPVCRRIMAVLQARVLECLAPKGNLPCGGCRSCRVIAGQHPDVRIIRPEKTVITVDQVRLMIGEISYHPFEAKYRVTILDPADQMRPEGMNSLLKTLEEPPSRTVMILVTTSPFLFPITIRSRARTLMFGGISQGEIERYLVESAGRKPEEASVAALFSNGSLGSAISFDMEAFRDIRAQALRFVTLLLGGRGFAEVSRIAAAVGKDKDKDAFLLWIKAMGGVLQDLYYAKIEPDRIGQKDVREEIMRLARGTTREFIASAIAALDRLKSGLAHNVNRPLAVESFFLSLQR